MSLRPDAVQSMQVRSKFALMFADVAARKLNQIEPENTYISLANFVEKRGKFQIWVRVTPQGTILVEGREKEAIGSPQRTKPEIPGTFDRAHLIYQYYQTRLTSEQGKRVIKDLEVEPGDSLQAEYMKEKKEPVQEIVRFGDRSDFGILYLDLAKLNPMRFNNIDSLAKEKEEIIAHIVRDSSERILSVLQGLTKGRWVRQRVNDLSMKKGFFDEGIFYKRIEEIPNPAEYKLTQQFDLSSLERILLEEPNGRMELAEKLRSSNNLGIVDPKTFIIHLGAERASVLERNKIFII